MKPIRYLMILSVLLATTLTAAAQQPSTTRREPSQQPAAPAPINPNRAPERVPDATPFGTEIQLIERAGQGDCPVMGTTSWPIQAIQQTVAAWQHLRDMCASGQQPAGCAGAGCGLSAVMKPASSVPAICGVKGCETAQPTKACCCAKACACCESCKANKPAAAAQQPPMCCPFPTFEAAVPPPVWHRVTGGSYPLTQVGGNVTWSGPMPAGMPGGCIVIALPVSNQAKPVRLETPDLEVHCERITHRGDMVVLEGNVLLLCKKHATPIRIEAQRVIVNMKDGSFSVESAGPTMHSSFGVMRSSTIEVPNSSIEVNRVIRMLQNCTPPSCGTTPSSAAPAPSTRTVPTLPQSYPYPLENVRPAERR